ncbi:HIT family protein [Thermodesulfobacteriota bacterium]
MKTSPDCIFCKIVAGEIPSTKIYEDDLSLGIMDVAPINKGHLLVIPKEHFETILEIDHSLYGHLTTVMCRIAGAVHEAIEPDGMNILQLNGKAANQVVPHLHIHLVPRWHEDGHTLSQWDWVQGDPDEIKAVAEQIMAKL